MESLLGWKPGLTGIFSVKSLLINKHSLVNGQRSLESRTSLSLRWIGVAVAARKALPLLPAAYGRGVVCVGPRICVPRVLQSQKEHIYVHPIPAAVLVLDLQVLPG